MKNRLHRRQWYLLCAAATLACLPLVTLKTGYSQATHAQDIGAAPAMNGYTFQSYPDFWKKMRLVTVRYREDSGEMRYTFANDLAWKALQEHSTDYPDGAVFGKVSMRTVKDPGFTSSIVPQQGTRYQIMVRDHKKHADTNGWGYAIFLPPEGLSPPEEQQADLSKGCDACHAIVQERGYVFSQPVSLDMNASSTPPEVKDPVIRWETAGSAKVPEAAKKYLPAAFKQVRFMIYKALQDNAHRGAMYETRPALIEEALKSGLPAILVSSDNALFTLAYVDPAASDCTAPSNKKGKMIVLVRTVPALWRNEKMNVVTDPAICMQLPEAK